MVYFLLDARTPQGTPLELKFKTRWHALGGALHIWIAYIIEHSYGHGWGYLSGALTWYFLDGAVNTWVFHKEWWWIGTTAGIDKLQRWIASEVRQDPRLVSAILKHILLLLTILNMLK